MYICGELRSFSPSFSMSILFTTMSLVGQFAVSFSLSFRCSRAKRRRRWRRRRSRGEQGEGEKEGGESVRFLAE